MLPDCQFSAGNKFNLFTLPTCQRNAPRYGRTRRLQCVPVKKSPPFGELFLLRPLWDSEPAIAGLRTRSPGPLDEGHASGKCGKMCLHILTILMSIRGSALKPKGARLIRLYQTPPPLYSIVLPFAAIVYTQGRVTLNSLLQTPERLAPKGQNRHTYNHMHNTKVGKQ